MEIFEKVNPAHPDKIADRIAGAILDLSDSINEKFISAVEVLIGHDKCLIINETNTKLNKQDIDKIVRRIAGDMVDIEYIEVEQDKHLADNQIKTRCGDNGIFKGVKTSKVEQLLTDIAGILYKKYGTDGKYLINTGNKTITICQSNGDSKEIYDLVCKFLIKKNENYGVVVNPIGKWTGGTNVDTGATNRKLGSDMGRAVSGGGLHGKDLSKADLSVNVYCNILAKFFYEDINASCSIGNEYVYLNIDKDYTMYSTMINVTKNYIKSLGGYEKFAEWGLIRPNND